MRTLCILQNSVIVCTGIHGNFSLLASGSNGPSAVATTAEFAEVTVVPVATAGPCNSPCRTIFPFLILLFFMTFIVAVTQMPLLMIVLRFVSSYEFPLYGLLLVTVHGQLLHTYISSEAVSSVQKQ
jgi:organic anion transporter 3A